MAIQPVSTTPPQTSNGIQPASVKQPSAAQKQQKPAADRVTISNTAKTLQENTQAPARLVEAASAGDLQAKAQVTNLASTKPASGGVTK